MLSAKQESYWYHF